MGHLFKRDGHLLRSSGGHLARCPEVTFCCDEGLPLSATVAGATGCYSVINGTYALAPSGLFPCQAAYAEVIAYPPDPCTAGTHCYSANETFPFPDGTRMVYWYPIGISVGVVLSSVDSSIQVRVAVEMEGWYMKASGFCDIRSLSTAGMEAIWDRSTCRTGIFTESSFSEPIPGSGRPTSVSLAW